LKKIKTDDPKYLKDSFSNAIIRNDRKNLEMHRMKVKQYNEIISNSNEINNLKKEIMELKRVMNYILEKISQE